MDEEFKFQPKNRDEVDLIDYIKVVIKRKWLIFVVFLLVLIVAGLFSWFSPKTYNIDTSLEIGSIGKDLLEAPTMMIKKNENAIYEMAAREKLGIPDGEYQQIKVENPKESNFLIFRAESTDPQRAKEILEGINKLILEEHQEKIKDKKESIENELKIAEDKIKSVENDIEKTKNKIKPINNDIERLQQKILLIKEEKESLQAKIETLQKISISQQDPGTQFALFSTKEELAEKKQEIEDLYLLINSFQRDKEDLAVETNVFKRDIGDLNSKINALKTSLDDIKETRIIKSPSVSAGPIKPRLKLNIIIAAVLGLFLGTLLAFVKEWWEKNKERI